MPISLKDATEFILNLSFRDKILLSLLAAGAMTEAVFDELYTPRSSLSSAGRFDGHSFKNSPYYRQQATQLRQELAHLLEKKWISFKGERGNRRFYLEEDGLDHLFSDFPVLKCRHSSSHDRYLWLEG